jgi:anti-anti-sigma factor
MSALAVDAVSDGVPSSSWGRASEAVILVGDYDISDVAALTSELDRVIGEGDSNPVVDLRDVTFMDASILNVLLRSNKYLRTESRELLIRSPSPVAQRLLTLCNDISPLGLQVIDDGVPSDGVVR